MKKILPREDANALLFWLYRPSSTYFLNRIDVPSGYAVVTITGENIEVIREGGGMLLTGGKLKKSEVFFIRKSIDEPLPWGVGGVRSADGKRNYKINGTLYISVKDERELVRHTFGANKDNVTPLTAVDAIKPQISAVVKTSLQLLLNDTVIGADCIREKLSPCFTKFGLGLDKFIVNEVI